MGNWRSHKIMKKNKGSQTPGSQKGDSCKASPLDRYMAKSGRSYKHPEYPAWCSKMDTINKVK